MITLVATAYAIDFKTGTTTGTGSNNLNVSVGFTPSYVKVCNYANSACMEWWSAMQQTTDYDNDSTNGGRGIKMWDNGTVYGSGNAVLIDNVTRGGIQKYTGSSSASKGFTIDNDTNINISGQTLYWMAIR